MGASFRLPSGPVRSERDLFLEALDQPTPADRLTFLAATCGDDPGLRAAVESLLRNHREDDFLASPAASLTRLPGEAGGTSPALEPLPRSVGQYRLTEQIGEGGCGTVFLAEQSEPVRRQVALKVIKPGMDTKSVIARFEAERQALALMDHPHIARVLDAGATEAGRPFFVMEVVRGIKLTEYCDRHRLPVRDRLRLFMQVCRAIEHAHQKGVIHRDIKPSNILVAEQDGMATPKVIDFGVAKATGQRLTDQTLVTELRAFVGTPAYTSPEQAAMGGLDVDTRTDIYSLGVLLYELLTGQTPFDGKELQASGLDEMRRVIREREPLPPSARLASMPPPELAATAAKQDTEPARLAARTRGDLDWIVMKALEKDRARRYATCGELALDLQRHLDNQPVLAGPPGRAYQFQKFARRNRTGLIIASAFLLALVAGLGLAAWQYAEKSRAYVRMVEAEHEQKRLREEAEMARQRAERQELAAHRKTYAADMNLAQQALAANNLGRARELLDSHRPPPGQPDLRGWEWRHLWQQCQSDALFTLCQQSNQVSAMAVSPDGALVAVRADDAAGLSVWDLRSRREVARLRNGGTRGAPMAFSPATNLLAYGMAEGGNQRERRHHVALWDAAASRPLGQVPLAGPCAGLAFSADGNTLLIASGDGRARFWSLVENRETGGCPLPELPRGGPGGGIFTASRDLALVAYSLGGGRIRVIDTRTGETLWTARAAAESVRSLAFSPDGKTLASGAAFVESSIRLWNVSTGAELPGRLEGHHTWISSLVFWPDGRTLASASADQTIRLWDLSDPVGGQTSPGVRSPRATLRGHQLEVWSLALLPDGFTLISGSKDGEVKVWDTRQLRRERSPLKVAGVGRTWRFTADSRGILALGADGSIARRTGPSYQEPIPVMNTAPNLPFASFSPSGRWLAAVHDGGVRVWDVEKGAVARDFPGQGHRLAPWGFIGPAENLIARDFEDRSLRELEITTGAGRRSWASPPDQAGWFGATFSPNAEWLLWLNGQGTGQLHHLSSGQRTELDLDIRDGMHTIFSPDGRLFAAGGVLGSGGIWHTATRRRIMPLNGFLQAMHSLAFSPDGTRLAAGGDGKEAIKLWDVESQRELLTLEGDGSFFESVTFSPNGELLACSNGQGVWHVWRAPGLAEIAAAEAAVR